MVVFRLCLINNRYFFSSVRRLVSSLKMAVAFEQNNTVSVQNSVEIVFVDEDDLPLANLMEHVQSDDDLDNDFELVQDEGEADTPNRTLPVPRGRQNENTE